MKFININAEIYIPDNTSEDIALSKTTHMAIGAHQDDLEIMAYDGIAKCYNSNENSFLGVVVTNGAGSPRSGKYESYTDEMMQDVRKKEQKRAAGIGKYGALAMLDFPSVIVKDKNDTIVIGEIKELIQKASPNIIYTHNLADKHDTHVAVAIKTILAIRQLPKESRPKKLFGCEVWRSLDWMLDSDKVVFDVDIYPELAMELLTVFDSQVAGGKRYDLATMGRRLANATYAASHDTDTSQALIYAMDLTPLIEDDNLSIAQFINRYIDNLRCDVGKRIDG